MMTSYEVEAVLETPCCISESPAMGNEVETLDHIPGSALRGMLADAYLRGGGSPDEAFRRIFCTDEIRFPNLYPAQRRPLPLSAHTCKRNPGFTKDEAETEIKHGVWDLLFEDCDDFTATCQGRHDRQERCDDGPLKPYDKRWYKGQAANLVSGDGAVHLTVTRTAVSPESGSALDGSLHTQQELARGSHFEGLLRASDASLPQDAGKKLVDALLERLGGEAKWFFAYTGRRRAGQVSLRLSKKSDDSQADFLNDWPKAANSQRYFAMTFRSDVILIDRLLRPIIALDHDGQTLKSEMGFPPDVEVVIEKAFVQARRVAGWNAVAGIFKPDDIAMIAGSTFLLTVPATAEDKVKDWMQTVIERGIGLRRAEGFGDVRFDEPLHLAAAKAKEKGGPL